MTRRPMVLVSPDIEAKGKEFGDLSISLSAHYEHALVQAGAAPLSLPATSSRDLLAECVRRCDGVLLTGGDDIDPRLYRAKLPHRVNETIETTPDHGRRDLRELIVIDEAFRQRKPLLAICRGHQMVNVALGGTLWSDIRSEKQGALNHQQLQRRNEIVHEVRLTPRSILARITGRQKLGVNSTHHQAVARIAPMLQVAATSPDGLVESTELRPNAATRLPFLLTVQFHPERLAGKHAEHRAIFRAFVSACAGRQNNYI